MEINANDIVKLKKISHCKSCKNDTFSVVKTGTEFVFKCCCCRQEKTISSIKLKICVKEVMSTIYKPTKMDF